MKKLTLNPLQIQHQHHPDGCKGKRCSVPDCIICLCGKRDDATHCCSEHRAEHHNKKIKIEDAPVIKRRRINKQNGRVFASLYHKGYREIDPAILIFTNFDDSVAPYPAILHGKQVAVYDKIITWIDTNGMLHLEKIK